MLVRPLRYLVLALVLVLVAGCAPHPSKLVSVTPTPGLEHRRLHRVGPTRAELARWDQAIWNGAVWRDAVWNHAILSNELERQRAEAARAQELRVAATSPARPVAAASAPVGVNWDCVANAETGGDWSMHGSGYSTALGIMNQAVRENASSEVAARVFAGTASRAEQVAIGNAIVARFGFGAWAASTVRKCG